MFDKKAYNRAYSKKHPKAPNSPEYMRAWRAANREKVRAYNKKWSAANPDKTRERDRRWTAANPDKIREKDLRRYASKGDAIRLRARLWHQDNPGRNHKIRRRGAACKCCALWSFKFIYAQGRALGMHVDHVKPLAKGGLHCLKNMQLLAPSDNLRKGARYVEAQPEVR
jgi:HNH endonuclease